LRCAYVSSSTVWEVSDRTKVPGWLDSLGPWRRGLAEAVAVAA